MIFFGEVVDSIVKPQENFTDAVHKQVVIFSILGAIGVVLGFLQAYILIWVADRQVARIKLLFYKVNSGFSMALLHF